MSKTNFSTVVKYSCKISSWLFKILPLTNSLLPKVCLSNSLSDFCFFTKCNLLNFAIFYTCKCIFGDRYATPLCGHVPKKEVGIQVKAGLAPSIQTVGSYLRTRWLAKKWPNDGFGEFTSVEKYTQLLFIECIRQSQKFVKPPTNLRCVYIGAILRMILRWAWTFSNEKKFLNRNVLA